MLRLPGLIDPHVHLREPGATHKEDWDSGTAAALAGGFTAVLAMPNTKPPITDAATLALSLDAAAAEGPLRLRPVPRRRPGQRRDRAATGRAGRRAEDVPRPDLRPAAPRRHDPVGRALRATGPRTAPIVAHAESRTMAAVILMATLFDRPVHIAHVSLREEILLIRRAKEAGVKVTCEVGPHHLFLSQDDISSARLRALGGPAEAGNPRRPAGAVGQPGRHRLLCHRPRAAYGRREGRRQPAARLPRPRDRAAAAADRRPRRPPDARRPRPPHARQPAAHLQPARPGRHLDRGRRRRRVRDPSVRMPHPLRLDPLRRPAGLRPRPPCGSARARRIPGRHRAGAAWHGQNLPEPQARSVRVNDSRTAEPAQELPNDDLHPNP